MVLNVLQEPAEIVFHAEEDCVVSDAFLLEIAHYRIISLPAVMGDWVGQLRK